MGQVTDINSAGNSSIIRMQSFNSDAELFKACKDYLVHVLSTGLRDYGIWRISVEVNRTTTSTFNIIVYLKKGICAKTEIEPCDYVFDDDAMVDLLKIFKDKIDKRLKQDSKTMPLEVN